MVAPIVLASGSSTRTALLAAAGVPHEAVVPRVDEDAIKAALLADGAPPRDVADALAEAKARRIALKRPEALVIGCDQVLEIEGRLLSKPETAQEAASQIAALSGRTHRLLSAAVVYEAAAPVWRHVGVVRLQMRVLSPEFINRYVARNWDSIRHSVGSYKLEEEGARLFTRVDGDYFTVLGMPLLELLNFFTLRGILDS